MRSASEDEANIHVSPGRLPKREPAGSVSMTWRIAWPTRPVPPVTRITSGIAVRGEEGMDGGGDEGGVDVVSDVDGLNARGGHAPAI